MPEVIGWFVEYLDIVDGGTPASPGAGNIDGGTPAAAGGAVLNGGIP